MMEREERRSGKSKRKEMLEQRGAEWASESVENDDG